MDAEYVVRQTRGSLNTPLVLEAGEGRTVTVPVMVLRAVRTHFPTPEAQYLALMAVACRAVLAHPDAAAVMSRVYRARLSDVRHVADAFATARESGIYT